MFFNCINKNSGDEAAWYFGVRRNMTRIYIQRSNKSGEDPTEVEDAAARAQLALNCYV